MNEDNRLADFAKKQNMKHLHEKIVGEDVSEETIEDKPRAVKQETGKENIEVAKAIAKIRMIINFLLMLPLLLTAIGLTGYILMNVLPSMLYLFKKFLSASLN